MEPLTIGLADLRRIAIVGRGLIGRSIELALGALAPGIRVTPLDRGDDLAAIEGADLVVLAAPVLDNIRLLDAIGPHLAPSTVVTDTGSTKVAIVEAASAIRFVGGHPIAGGTTAGAGAARPDLFAGQRWILTPTSPTPSAALDLVSALVEALGARTTLLDPLEHDRILALVSHLPQLAVSALMDAVGTAAGADGLALAGPGLRDSTRLAASAPGIWRDVLATNRAPIAAALDRLIDGLTRLRDDRDGAELARIFERAAAWKQAMDERPL